MSGSECIPTIAITVVAASLVGATLIVARSCAAARLGATRLVASIVLGLAIDAAVGAGFGSWDLVWQSGVSSLVVVRALGLIVLAVWIECPAGVAAAPTVPPAVGASVSRGRSGAK